MAETFEIKVYEIDDVERLQKRRDKGNKVTDGKVNPFRTTVKKSKEGVRRIYCGMGG